MASALEELAGSSLGQTTRRQLEGSRAGWVPCHGHAAESRETGGPEAGPQHHVEGHTGLHPDGSGSQP